MKSREQKITFENFYNLMPRHIMSSRQQKVMGLWKEKRVNHIVKLKDKMMSGKLGPDEFEEKLEEALVLWWDADTVQGG